MGKERTERRVYEPLIASISKERAFGFVKDLDAIGNRWLGGGGESSAREYILEKFRDIGLENIHIEEFEYLHYTPQESKIEIVSPVHLSLSCEPLQYTKNARVEGQAVYVGLATEDAFERLEKLGVDFEDKIVVVETYAPFLFTALCERKKIGGLIVISDAPKGYIRRMTGKLDPKSSNPTPPYERYLLSFPGATSSYEDGQKLLSLLSVGEVRVRVTHTAKYERRTSSNVIGSVEGTAEPEKKVVVGCHYDTQLAGHGAYDNGGGVAAILELARALVGKKPRRSVVFAAFAGEEIGVVGSAAYISAHKDDLVRNGVGMVNFEGPGAIFPADNNVWATKNILKLALAKAREANWDVMTTRDASKIPSSDFYPFAAIGVPTAMLWNANPVHPYYHTEKDTIEYISPEALVKGIEPGARLALHLAFEREFV